MWCVTPFPFSSMSLTRGAKMKLIILSVAMSCFLLGCGGDAVIDGSSQAAFEKSIEKVSSSLNESQRAEFAQAIMSLTMRYAFEDRADDALMKDLDGLSADEVIVKLKALVAEDEARELAEAQSDLKELEIKIDAANSAREQLKAVVVQESRLYIQKSDWRTECVMHLKVKNGLDQAIARIFFHGAYKDPERAVPWNEDEFNYRISGGLESGEVGDWKLNGDYSWKQAASNEGVFHVVVTRVQLADGTEISSEGLSEWEQKEYNKLKTKLGLD